VESNTAEIPFIQRLQDEKKELDEKITKLDAFIKGNIFPNIDQYQQSMLLVQHQTMKTYRLILAQRIDYLITN
jgi:hypothetical protein